MFCFKVSDKILMLASKPSHWRLTSRHGKAKCGYGKFG